MINCIQTDNNLKFIKFEKIITSYLILCFLRGGEVEVHPDFFVKLDFEIAVYQQTRAHDRTFEGVPDSG